MNKIVVMDPDGQVDLFQSEDVRVLHDCLESYPDNMYFYANVEFVLSEPVAEDPRDALFLIHTIHIAPECTIVTFKNGYTICSHMAGEAPEGSLDDIPSLRSEMNLA